MLDPKRIIRPGVIVITREDWRVLARRFTLAARDERIARREARERERFARAALRYLETEHPEQNDTPVVLSQDGREQTRPR